MRETKPRKQNPEKPIKTYERRKTYKKKWCETKCLYTGKSK